MFIIILDMRRKVVIQVFLLIHTVIQLLLKEEVQIIQIKEVLIQVIRIH